MKKIKLLGGLLLIALCTAIFVTGCGKKEEKAKITLTKTQIKYEENAKDILNEYINIRLELMSIGDSSIYKNKDEVTKKINDLYARLEKLVPALDSLEIASDEISKTKSKAELIALADSNISEVLVPTVYAAESTDRAKEWAEEITKAYDSYPTGKQLKGLAAYLGTDVKTAMKQLQVAQGVMYNEYENEADMYDDLKDIAEVVQTTCKVELFVAGFPANGVTTLTEAGVTLLNGVDTLVAVSNTGADIILGENHNVTVYTNLLKDGLSPITSITGLLTFDSSFTSNADRISYIGDSLNSLIFEGKLFGGIIDLNEEDNTYIGKTYETIGACEDDGFKINKTESESFKLTPNNIQEFADILEDRKDIEVDITSATTNLNEIKADVENEVANLDENKNDESNEVKNEEKVEEDKNKNKGDFDITGIYLMDVLNEESGFKRKDGIISRFKVERDGNTITCIDLSEEDGELTTFEYDPSTHIASLTGIVKMVLEFNSNGELTYSLYNPQSGEGGWVFKGHKE